MVFGIGGTELETLECQTRTDRESCPMTAAAVTLTDLHLVTATEVIATSDIDALTDEHVDTQGDMLDETGVPTVEARQGSGETQRCRGKTFGDTQLQVDRYLLVFVPW